jgi:hypothetical protein
MRDLDLSNIIKLSYLKDLQQLFHKEIAELIDIYLHDAKRKIANLYKALEESNIANFTAAARELRVRSIDIGAITFSHRCLSLEVATQEFRLEALPQLALMLEKQFMFVKEELERLKSAKKKLGERQLEYL